MSIEAVCEVVKFVNCHCHPHPAPAAPVAAVDWSAVGAIATIVAGVLTLLGVGIAVATLVSQSRSLRRTLASQTYHGLVAHFNEFQRMLAEQPDLRRDIFEQQPDRLTSARRHEINWVLGILFNWYEDAALQSETWKVIPQHLSKHWKRMLANELRSPVVAAYWEMYGDRFHPQLGAWVSDARATTAVARAGH